MHEETHRSTAPISQLDHVARPNRGPSSRGSRRAYCLTARAFHDQLIALIERSNFEQVARAIQPPCAPTHVLGVLAYGEIVARMLVCTVPLAATERRLRPTRRQLERGARAITAVDHELPDLRHSLGYRERRAISGRDEILAARQLITRDVAPIRQRGTNFPIQLRPIHELLNRGDAARPDGDPHDDLHREHDLAARAEALEARNFVDDPSDHVIPPQLVGATA
ncbi:MAG: hypothetical protein ABI175_29885 [Polyangiales bacterium]